MRQNVSDGKFPSPKAKEVQPRRCARITGAIKGLADNHPIGIEDKTGSDDAKTTRAILHHIRLWCEKGNDRIRKHDKEQSDGSEKDEVVECSAPNRGFGPVRLSRAEVL